MSYELCDLVICKVFGSILLVLSRILESRTCVDVKLCLGTSSVEILEDVFLCSSSVRVSMCDF